jgi:hypothetical protein
VNEINLAAHPGAGVPILPSDLVWWTVAGDDIGVRAYLESQTREELAALAFVVLGFAASCVADQVATLADILPADVALVVRAWLDEKGTLE